MRERNLSREGKHLTIDDVVDGVGTSVRIRRRKRQRLQIAAVVIVVILFGVLTAAALHYRPQWFETGPSSPTKETTAVAGAAASADPAIDLPPPDLLKPLSSQQAQQANAERPVVTRPDDPASRFRLSGDAISKLRAIDCLTQAVYYEAASEGLDGGRAVAQVVLNRVRHPAYPNSVCGVVYQGSERATGCQFTFTCDGSLARTPLGYLWQRSKLIATEALAGRVFAAVGHATHYHADYVVPYWADSLDKVAVIGRHIFYRLRGTAGARGAFAQPYRGTEPAPPLPPSDVLPLDLTTLPPDETVTAPEEPKVEEDRIEAAAAPGIATPAESGRLEADLARGQLILGEPAPATRGKGKTVSRESAPCAAPGGERIRPIGADDLKAGAAQPSC